MHFLSQLGNVKKNMALHVMAHRRPNLYCLMKKSPLIYHKKSCLHSVVLKKLECLTVIQRSPNKQSVHQDGGRRYEEPVREKPIERVNFL